MAVKCNKLLWFFIMSVSLIFNFIHYASDYLSEEARIETEYKYNNTADRI